MRSFEIKENDANQRLDKFLSKAVPRLPKSLMYKFIRTKKIKVNRKRAEINQMLNVGDIVLLFISEEFFENEKDDFYKFLNKVFDVVYEDENLLIVNKPVGLLCHSDENGGVSQNTLIDQIKGYLWQKGEYIEENENSFAPALCNRIDRNTGGLVICAKNAETLRIMNLIIKERWLSKYYICLVQNRPKKDEDTLTGYIIKDSDKNMVKVYDTRPNDENAKKIITKYKYLCQRKNGYELEIELVTGRTHQIRAHMAHIGCPLVGEGKYARKDDSKIQHQALWAYKIEFHDLKDTILSYLSNKIIEINKKQIPFLND